MPIGDWQFWVVTGAAVVAVAYLLRALGAAGARRRRGKRVTLTVGGKPRR